LPIDDALKFIAYEDIFWVMTRTSEPENAESRAENKTRKARADYLIRHPAIADQFSTVASAAKLAITPVAMGKILSARHVAADPATGSELMNAAASVREKIPGDLYGYDRAFKAAFPVLPYDKSPVVLDATSGGGSIPLQAMRAGCSVIANELNPVATVILHATLDYPRRFGSSLAADIRAYGDKLIECLHGKVERYFPDVEAHGIADYIFCRQVTSPHGKRGEAPLLNSLWLSKEPGNLWAVRLVPAADGKTVAIEPYRVTDGKGPNGEDPNAPGTVSKGVGRCPYTGQQIDGAEIKAQACGKSALGRWADRLYAVAVKRREAVLDKDGTPVLKRNGEPKTAEVVAFRAPTQADLDALTAAASEVEKERPRWEAEGLLPTEKLPTGQKTSEPQRYGMARWCDMFTARQLLCHMTAMEGLIRIKADILADLGDERGKAVITYLQFVIDKALNYGSKQCAWHTTRALVANTFSRHDFGIRWTFGEMASSATASCYSWSLAQIVESYRGLAELVSGCDASNAATIINASASAMPSIADGSVDLVCMDPPYYAKVQYAELSDFFYVWQKRVLGDLFGDLFRARQTNKTGLLGGICGRISCPSCQ
jgi:adenine-specific DNA methylase